MRMGLIHSILVVVGVAVPSVVLSQTPPSPGAAKAPADLSGVWELKAPTASYFAKEPPPLQPWAEAKSRPNRLDPKDPVSSRDNSRDPYVNCAPPGLPRVWLAPTPFEIFQVPGRVLILYESDHTVRQIWTDGRGHPKGVPHSWTGHSIGHWDGDTLVVDTIGLNDGSWLDYQGNVHSDALHLVERLRRVDQNTLSIRLTMEDPKAFTKPYTAERFAQLRPDWVIGEYVICEDRYLQLVR